MSNKKIYWVCQVAGWSSMVFIDTINYVFFIFDKFSWERFITIVGYAILGILLTHLFRFMLKKHNYFQKSKTKIWVAAIVSIFVIAFALSLSAFVINLLIHIGAPAKGLTINAVAKFFAGSTMNWIRYTSVWVIIYFMYKILQQNNAIQQEKLLLENLAKTTELELLKTQLNPHFLFNALNSIKALVIINPEQSRDAIVKLSELLRFTLQYGKEQLIPLKDEINEVKKYLELEQLRFGNRLSIEFVIAENTYSQTIPPAIVLTLAENAIKHGVAKNIGNSNILIESYIDEELLALKVKNTGIYQAVNTEGIGLKHISKRLEEIYHHKATFLIEQENEQVVSTIQTPLSWQ